MESLEKYLAATGHHLGVEGERYGGGYRALVLNRFDADFLFGMLEGNDFEGTQAQAFFGANPLFPATHAATPTQAIRNLDAKLSIMYRFEPNDGVVPWLAVPQFELRAEYDGDPDDDETTSSYEVQWGDVVQDLRGGGAYFYESARDESTSEHKRDLHALVNFKYEGAFAQLVNL